MCKEYLARHRKPDIKNLEFVRSRIGKFGSKFRYYKNKTTNLLFVMWIDDTGEEHCRVVFTTNDLMLDYLNNRADKSIQRLTQASRMRGK